MKNIEIIFVDEKIFSKGKFAKGLVFLMEKYPLQLNRKVRKKRLRCCSYKQKQIELFPAISRYLNTD